MALAPEAPVALHVDQIPGRERQHVEVLQELPRASAPEEPAVQDREAGDVDGVVGRSRDRVVEACQHLAERDLPLADEDVARARAEVGLGVVRGVVPRHDDGMPRARASPIIRNAASRMRDRHIFVNQLKESS